MAPAPGWFKSIHEDDRAPSSFYPRQAKPAHLAVEDRISPEAQNDLARRGHELDLRGPWTIGRLCAVAREGAMAKAAAKPAHRAGLRGRPIASSWREIPMSLAEQPDVPRRTG